MFGYVIVNKGDLKFREFDIYHSYYCGLCRSLKERYGFKGQLSLSYDMTFLVMLLTGLYEPEIREKCTGCVVHPFGKQLTRRNEFTDYGADMNVLFTCYKCRDDWEDEKKLLKLAYGKLMKSSFKGIGARYGEKVKRIDGLMRRIAKEEQSGTEDIDRMAGLFGEIMGEIFAVKSDEWEDNLRNLGRYLGKYIYILDAYEDIEDDLKSNRYNPLKDRYEHPDFDEEIRVILTMMITECCREFEKLPILDNVEILRNILYSGIWYRYEAVRQKRDKGKGQEE